jgi:hypothetical protein
MLLAAIPEALYIQVVPLKSSNARPGSNDALEGTGLRIYNGEELVAEIVRPTSFATKESWEKK